MKTLSISKSLYDKFLKDRNNGKYAGQRLGQAFFNHFSLHKCNKGDDPTLDRLYNADNSTAEQMIFNMIDWEN